MSILKISIIKYSFIFILLSLNFITIQTDPTNKPIELSTTDSNSTTQMENPPPTDEDLTKKYQDLLAKVTELDANFQKLLQEHQKNEIQIQINQVYIKALYITLIILAIILLIVIIIKIYKAFFTKNITSELLMKSISDKLFNQKKESENKIIQNNINVSSYNLFDSYNTSINNVQINDKSFCSCGKNYDAPAMAFN